MSENYERLMEVVQTAIAHGSQPTRQIIRERVEAFRQVPDYCVTDEEADQMCRELESRLDISMNIGSVVKENFHEWLSAEKASIDPYYWDRYRKLLEQQGFPPRVIARLDEVTERLAGLLENPKRQGAWDRRGMVVGHVQSGKTANYSGLICKAADAGYKLIIVIAGIHNNLRNQTQGRIDEGFVGRDSAAMLNNNRNKVIGVGRFDSNRRPVTLTNTVRDFNKQTATANGMELRSLKEPAVLVIKKNTHTLRNLVEWLKVHNMQNEGNFVDAPMLLIDDEADNASINISKDPEKASRINSLIRELLSVFNRRCYVGYTATPFANIFIDPNDEREMIGDDLFPRDFIVSLDPPSNYFGADKVFGDSEQPGILKLIDDHESVLPLNHKIDHDVDALPASLKEAVRCFVLARAVRVLRGQPAAHNSMLVNASRFVNVQAKLRDALHDYVSTLERRIRYEKSKDPEKAKDDELIQEVFTTWSHQYSTLETTWEDVYGVLLESIAPISVVEINSRSATGLDYEAYEDNGRHIIAVGGFSLSRGLTLEGLTVSYFLRNSIMYDTLMQMGRWFGYRPGYQDLCRVWMTEDAAGWYGHIAEAIEELRDELRSMEQAGMTPEDFGLKVRSHPANLIVTAKNKMGTAQEVAVKIGLSNAFIETFALAASASVRSQNIDQARKLFESLKTAGVEPESIDNGSLLWANVPVDHILEFLSNWRNHKECAATDPGPVVDYINRRNPEELRHWDVLLVGVSRKDARISAVLGPEIGCQQRSIGTQTDEDCIWITSNYRVASRGVEKAGLSGDQILSAKDWWEHEAQAKSPPKNPTNIPDHAYRRHRTKPLLLVHLLDLLKSQVEEEVVAWGISFPPSNADDPTVEYVVNTSWMKEAWSRDVEGEEIEEPEND